MRLKTYFASGVDAAMNLARQELGPEAMLVHSKRTMGEAQALGSFEVVFAVADAVPVVSSPSSQADAGPVSPSLESGKHAEQTASAVEIARLSRLMEQTLRLVRRSEVILRSNQFRDNDRVDLEAALEDAGFTSDFRHRLSLELPESSASIRQRVLLWLDRQLRVAPQLGKAGFARKTVVVVGPPGAGKTTALIKLAARFGVACRRPAQILSMDSERVGASEMLRMHAGVLGIGFQLLDTTHALSQALAEHAHKDLILIDTAGYPMRSISEASTLSAFLVSRKEIDTHLVLPADLPCAVIRTHIANYASFEPAKLIFTKLDEVPNQGAVVEAAISERIPISYVTAGQRVPEDLSPADKPALLEAVLPHWLDGDPDQQHTRRAAA